MKPLRFHLLRLKRLRSQRSAASATHAQTVAGRRQRLGRASEQLAARFLRSRGYVIEETNVRFPVGEIDIVARDGQTLCFVDVRSVSSMAWGGPLASITDQKRRRLIRAAQLYLQRRRVIPAETRFDVVGIHWVDGVKPILELVDNAFLAD